MLFDVFLWCNSKWLSCARVSVREICARKCSGSFYNGSIDARVGLLKPILSALSVNIESLMRFPFSLSRCLTVFKVENPSAHKKTKFDRQKPSFFIFPSSFHDRFSHHKSHPEFFSRAMTRCKIDTLDQVRSSSEKADGQWSVQSFNAELLASQEC